MDGIKQVITTNISNLPICILDNKYFADKIGLEKDSTEDYIEGHVNDLFVNSTRMLPDMFSTGNKAWHSDGFHISKYFTVLTEHKRGKLTHTTLRYAIDQAIFYYWQSIDERGNLPDNLKYIMICDIENTYILKISDHKKCIKEIFRKLNKLKANKSIGSKNGFTASNIYKNTDIDFTVAAHNLSYKTQIYSYERFSEGVLWMFNEWEKDCPTEVEILTKLN